MANGTIPAERGLALEAERQALWQAASAMVSRAALATDVRFDRITEVQQAIAMGTYNVYSALVADKLFGG